MAMTAEDGAPNLQLRVLAESFDLSHPELRRFVELALGQLDAATEQAAQAQHQLQKLAESAELADRLAILVDEQADELTQLQTRLRDITAMCDLAEWSCAITGGNSAPAVLLSDLRRALNLEQRAVTEGGS
jgi:hypothetical protein